LEPVAADVFAQDEDDDNDLSLLLWSAEMASLLLFE
jgi:hypothetical protein